MKPEEVFTRTVFGVLLVIAAFLSWGRWITLSIGILFLISAFQGFCLTCFLYRKFSKEKENI